MAAHDGGGVVRDIEVEVVEVNVAVVFENEATREVAMENILVNNK